MKKKYAEEHGQKQDKSSTRSKNVLKKCKQSQSFIPRACEKQIQAEEIGEKPGRIIYRRLDEICKNIVNISSCTC